jgi:2-polyprenyl-3-methyl-5-hydroxy-6-metoxy-1,4-benzoquinol methylase
MPGGQVPDHGPFHPEAAGGQAFNGEVGLGVARLTLKIVAAQPGVRTICDFGCGNGYLAGQLGQRGFTVLGIEPTDTYLAIAREHHAGERVTFMKGMVGSELVEQLAARHPPFDLVVSSDVIEHMYDPLDFLTTACSVLRPGGVAVIGTPYHGYLKNVAISLTGRWDLHHSVHWHGGHIKFFSVAALSKMMRHAGFNEPRFEFYGKIPGLWKTMIAIATKPDAARVE